MMGGRLDLTEREQAELAARRMRQRFELLAEMTQVGIWFCDLPFGELVWDQRVKEHFWLSPDAKVTIELFYERLHPEDRERTRAALDAALANKSR
jgi:PAS domain-containing protein